MVIYKYKEDKKILEDQLHQQFAENDNNRISVFTSFIVGIIALFGFYGYVFVNTNKRKCWNFDIQEYLLMSVITLGILCFLAILALNLGYSHRRDQFIVYNIRKKRYKENVSEMKEIFGELYSPLNKCFFSFLPDFYDLFYWLFLFSELFIIFTINIKVNEIENLGILYCNYKSMLFLILIFFTIIIRIYYYFGKYKRFISPCKCKYTRKRQAQNT